MCFLLCADYEMSFGRVNSGTMRIFVQPGAFEPEVIAAMSEAFEAACNELKRTGQAAAVREVIAGRIVAAATACLGWSESGFPSRRR